MVILFIAVPQWSLADDPCVAQDCGSQLLFPVLSSSDVANDDWAVSTGAILDSGQRPITSSVQVWTAAAAVNDNVVWPIPASNDNNDDTSRSSPLAADNDDNYYYEGQLELQDGDTNKYSQTVKSTTHFQHDNTPTGILSVLSFYCILRTEPQRHDLFVDFKTTSLLMLAAHCVLCVDTILNA